ncbi:Permease for cytosine/purines, uracil, thiamine, allantoin [Corynebacterium glaucum]|uniref:purine-cytosine permease family protein n=1 Tax=Corynebacterium glaucum TaxID=187491 RepID=UPI0025B50145|nr:cytosine permease [Corynebacterium glaucum]WJZ07128.1 Permease for cytosine/purines, uracil, thiamine, allantoin [Corynebacterium glaucum]
MENAQHPAASASGTAPVIETRGIDIVPEHERTAKPSDLFWPWFAANVSVFGISYGSFLLWFGISFWQAAIVTAIGVTFSFFLCGLIAVAGKRGSVPTMVLSRAAFGVHGQKVPGIVSWLTSIGWETSLSIMAVLAITTVIRQLGAEPGLAVPVAATVIVAALIVGASVLGYHTIMKLQSVLTWLTGAITVLYILLTVPQIDWAAVQAIPAGSTGAVIGALVMVMTGFGLGWINIAADWSRYQRRDTPDSAIIFWNTFGGAVAPVLLIIFGLLIAGSDPALAEAIADDPIGALAVILPTWVLVPFLLTAVLALVSGAVLGIYSSGLTLITLGIDIPRPAAAAIDGLILTAGTIYVVFFAQSFLGPFQSFLITLGVPLASWAGILIADIFSRTQDYDEAALYDADGRYGAVDWASIAIMAIASVVGWGLVANAFAEEAAWNNWQGYLLPLVGEHWADANLGVLVALVFSFVAAWLARRGTIRRQEGREGQN